MNIHATNSYTDNLSENFVRYSFLQFNLKNIQV